MQGLIRPVSFTFATTYTNIRQLQRREAFGGGTTLPIPKTVNALGFGTCVGESSDGDRVERGVRERIRLAEAIGLAMDNRLLVR